MWKLSSEVYGLSHSATEYSNLLGPDNEAKEAISFLERRLRSTNSWIRHVRTGSG